MSINLLYSKLLSDSALQSDNYQRRLSQEDDTKTVRVDVRKVLMPFNSDRGYMNFCAEQLVQICRSSVFKADLARLDPRNTYQYPFTGFPELTTQVSDLPDGFGMDILEPSIYHQWIDNTTRIAVDVAGSRVQVNEVWYPITLPSAAIPLAEGVNVIFKGVMPGADFLVDVVMQRRPWRDNAALVPLIQDMSGRVVWHDPYAEYKAAPESDLLIAAFVMNWLEYDGN